LARGQSQKADTQLGITNKAAGQYGQNAQQLYGQLTPMFTQEATSQGYDPATKAAMTESGMGGVAAQGAAQQEGAARRAAKTRNEAGQGALQESLARSRMLASGNEANQLQKQFSDYRTQQQQAGLRGLESLYGIGADTMAKLYGLGPSTLQARAAGGGGFMSTLGKLIGAGGELGAAAIEHG